MTDDPKIGLPPALQAAQRAIDAAHFLLVWTYQADVACEPPMEPDGMTRPWRVWHLHPSVRGKMNNAEQDLYDALAAARGEG